MYYYDVIVLKRLGTPSKQESFIYQAASQCMTGEIVSVPFGKKRFQGVVLKTISKPARPNLKELKPYPVPLILPSHNLALAQWMSSYYVTHLGTVLRAFIPSSLTRGTSQATPQEPALRAKLTQPMIVPLTKDQQQVTNAIAHAPGLHVLHGVTGSGKTHVYLRLAQQALERNQNVLILIPEIALTAQLVEAFYAYFGDRVHLQHSSLTSKDRRELWLTAYGSSGSEIWIGTRSSLFLPLKRLGLIVLDEFHDQSYKQDSQPKYNAATVAARLGELTEAIIVFGSATPGVRDLYVAAQKKVPVHKLTQPVMPRSSTVEVVDLRSATRSSPTIPWLTQPLEQAIEGALERSEQVLLFLNRRGNATQLRCKDCGWHMDCKQCALSLVYHEDLRAMLCHGCGQSQPVPLLCPECGAADILLKGYGTKEVEKMIARRFPEQRILRFDRDSLQPSGLGAAYQDMKAGTSAILVGTQMLAKGFDLPHLTTVGVIDADTMLQLPDFSANERTFQLLTQVLGRGSRRGQQRHIVVQTYQPDHPIIQAAAEENYQRFYEYELAQRRSIGLPPFRYLLKITTQHRDAQRAAKALSDIVARAPDGITFLGPAPAFHGKDGDQSVWQLIGLSRRRQLLSALVETLPQHFRSDLDPLDLL